MSAAGGDSALEKKDLLSNTPSFVMACSSMITIIVTSVINFVIKPLFLEEQNALLKIKIQ